MSYPSSTTDHKAPQGRKRLLESEPHSDAFHAAKRPRQDSNFLQSFKSAFKVPFCKMAEWVVKKGASFRDSFHTRAVITPHQEGGLSHRSTSHEDIPPEGYQRNQEHGVKEKKPVYIGEESKTLDVPVARSAKPATSVTGQSTLSSVKTSTAGKHSVFRRRQDIRARTKQGTPHSVDSKRSSSARILPEWRTPKKPVSPVSWRTNKSYTSLYEKTYPRPLSIHNSTNRREHHGTAVNSINIKEKELYRQLLQQYTTSATAWNTSQLQTSLGSNQLSFVSANKTSESQPKNKAFWKEKVIPVTVTHTNAVPSSESSRKLKQSAPVQKELAKPEPRECDEIVVIDDEDDEDDEIQCISDEKRTCKDMSNVSVTLEATSPRAVCPSNEAFKNHLVSSPYTHSDWLQQIKENIEKAQTERKLKISEEEVKVKVYKELHEKEAKRLEQQIREQMRLEEEEPAVIEESYEEEEEEEEELPELTTEMQEIIDNALVPYPDSEVLVTAHRIAIHRRDMATLAGLNWLNDEVINFYMSMLAARGGKDDFPKVHVFNTFFYQKLMSGGHPVLKRWTRRVDIFSFDFILIPVHLGMHWCLAIVDFNTKRLRYFDSMGGKNHGCLRALRQYLQDESMDKKNIPFDMSDWTDEIVKDIPSQMNGSDCGMFACKYAEYITRKAEITFTQEDMPYFRRRMVYEILTNTLL